MGSLQYSRCKQTRKDPTERSEIYYRGLQIKRRSIRNKNAGGIRTGTIKPKRFDDYVNTNIVENSVKNNTKSFDRIQCNTEQYRNSFFKRPILDWNHLEENIVSATSVERIMKKRTQQYYLSCLNVLFQ